MEPFTNIVDIDGQIRIQFIQHCKSVDYNINQKKKNNKLTNSDGRTFQFKFKPTNVFEVILRFIRFIPFHIAYSWRNYNVICNARYKII